MTFIKSKRFQSGFNLRIVAAVVFLALLTGVWQVSMASERLVQKYQELAKLAGFEFTYGDLEIHSADSFTLNDITLIRFGLEDPVKIKSLKLEGVRELSGNGLAAQSLQLTGLSWDGVNANREELIISLREARVDGFYMPDPTDRQAPFFLFDNYKVALNDLFVILEGNPVFGIPLIAGEFNRSDNSTKYGGFMKASGLKVLPANFNDNGNISRQLKGLGYDTLNMDINLEAVWDLESGLLELNKYEFDVADVGAVNIQMSIGGYNEELAREMRASNAEIQSLPADQRALASLKVLESMGALTLQSLKLSFRDNSITDKLLTRQAQAMGQPVENMKAMLPIMLSGALASLQQPQLAAKLIGAVEQFLAQPGTISVGANPDEPLTFAEITGMATSLPDLLIEKLNITAEAK
ncbi:MAG: hypothetical protein L3J32_09375 [Rhizobiaceae bacterium]|nr:hypothetical protein [Rhizobiaceae bacterium]